MKKLLRVSLVCFAVLQVFVAGCSSEPGTVDAPPPSAEEQKQMDEIGKVPGR